MRPGLQALLFPSGIPRRGLVCWHDLYDPTESLQSIPDLSGHGYALQRGSAAGADSNDPTWVAGGKGLSFVTDDYALTGNLGDPATPCTLLFVVASDAVGGFVGGFGNAANNYIALQLSGSSGVHGVASSGSTGSLVRTPGATECFVVVSGGNGVPLRFGRCRDGLTWASDGPALSVVGGASPVVLGSNRLGGSTFLPSGTAYEHLCYDCTLSYAEIARIYRAVKSTWAGRGVNVL
jgi:hypothetical protein